MTRSEKLNGVSILVKDPLLGVVTTWIHGKVHAVVCDFDTKMTLDKRSRS